MTSNDVVRLLEITKAQGWAIALVQVTDAGGNAFAGHLKLDGTQEIILIPKRKIL